MDAFQKFLRWFVGGVLWDEFAGEGAGEEGGRELVHLPACFGQPQLNLVGQRKQSLHSSHAILKSRQGRPTIAHGFNRGLRM